MKSLYYNIRRWFSNLCYYIRKLLRLPDPVDFKYVDILFENCDGVRIPSRLIEFLYIRDIHKDVFTNCCQRFVETYYCKEFQITLNNEALKIKTNFQNSFKGDDDSFERHLKIYKDITNINVKPNKSKEFYVAIPYKTKDVHGTINLLQKNKFMKDNFIISSKEK